MPRRRKAAREYRRNHKPLTLAEQVELCIGPVATRSAFPDDASRRRGWIENRAELMRLLPPDGRGWAYVVYEGGGFLPEDDGRILAALARIDQEKRLAT